MKVLQILAVWLLTQKRIFRQIPSHTNFPPARNNFCFGRNIKEEIGFKSSSGKISTDQHPTRSSKIQPQRSQRRNRSVPMVGINESSFTEFRWEFIQGTTTPAILTKLEPAVEDARDILKEEYLQNVSLFDVFSRGLNRSADDLIGEYLNQIVSFLLVDPTYNTRSELNLRNWEYDDWTGANMGLLVQCTSLCMFYGAHGHIFVSYMQSELI